MINPLHRRAAIAGILAAWCICSGFAQTTSARDAILQRRGYVRILLQANCRSLEVTVPGGARVVGGSSSGGAQSASTYRIAATGGAVEISADGKTLAKGTNLTIEPQSKTQHVFRTPGGIYRGRLLLIAQGSGFKAVNEVQLDYWLMGVLPAEIGDSHMEALKAQAVAARSEAIYKLAKPPHKGEGYDFCTGVHCQAYKGASKETEDSRKACLDTFGVVLIADNEIIDAVYHNVCGGATAGAEDVWDSTPKPALVPIFDEQKNNRMVDLRSDAAIRAFVNSPRPTCFCRPEHPDYPNYAKKYYRWKKTMTAAQMERIMGIGRIRDISVVERRPSGRVRKLQIVGERDSRTLEKELPIRNKLDLWSGLFYIDVQRAGSAVQTVTFVGAGNGHGVGLCQMGARTMGTVGYKYDQILQHYYRGAQVQKIYRP